MTARSAELQGRRVAEAIMLDTATVHRPSGEPTFVPATGAYTMPAATLIHTGPCRVRTSTTIEATELFGEQQVSISRLAVLFPFDIPEVMLGDTVTITDSDDVHMIGREFRVVLVPFSTFTTARSLGCEVVT